MTSRIPFSYGEFYDVPRMLRFELGGKWYFLRSHFVEDQDQYTSDYEVYLLPHRTEAEIAAAPHDWMKLTGAVYLGRVRVAEVGLDETRRLDLDAGAMTRWLVANNTSVAPSGLHA